MVCKTDGKVLVVINMDGKSNLDNFSPSSPRQDALTQKRKWRVREAMATKTDLGIQEEKQTPDQTFRCSRPRNRESGSGSSSLMGLLPFLN